MNDPIIDGIRNVRAKLAQDAGNDFQKFCQIVSQEAKSLRESGQWRMVSELPAASADVLKDEPLSDPTAEVRRVREKIWAECGKDIHKFSELIRKEEAELRASGKYKLVQDDNGHK